MISFAGIRSQLLACGISLTLVSLVLVGCSPTGNSSADTQAGSDGETFSPSSRSSIPPLLNQVEGSLETTAFRGVRRVREVRGADVLEQLEDVGSDGQGGFAIELVDIISLTPEFEENSYLIFFESGARFRWQLRDFQLRNLGLAAFNYRMTVTADTPVVAGIPCVTVEFERQNQVGDRAGIYEIDVDPATGFVLGCREFDDAGAVIFESAYESFTYGGDISDMILRGRTFAATPLDLAGELNVQTGFNAKFPDLLPDGFEVVSAEVMTIPASLGAGAMSFLPTGEWLRLTATDGVEALVFAHAAGAVQATTRGTSEFRILQQGTWEIGYGNIAETMFVIAARATTDELRRMIVSSL